MFFLFQGGTFQVPAVSFRGCNPLRPGFFISGKKMGMCLTSISMNILPGASILTMVDLMVCCILNMQELVSHEKKASYFPLNPGCSREGETW